MEACVQVQARPHHQPAVLFGLRPSASVPCHPVWVQGRRRNGALCQGPVWSSSGGPGARPRCQPKAWRDGRWGSPPSPGRATLARRPGAGRPAAGATAAGAAAAGGSAGAARGPRSPPPCPRPRGALPVHRRGHCSGRPLGARGWRSGPQGHGALPAQPGPTEAWLLGSGRDAAGQAGATWRRQPWCGEAGPMRPSGRVTWGGAEGAGCLRASPRGGVTAGPGRRRKGRSGSWEPECGRTHASVSLRSDPSPGGQRPPLHTHFLPLAREGRGVQGPDRSEDTGCKPVTAASSLRHDATSLSRESRGWAPLPQLSGGHRYVFCWGSLAPPSRPSS